MPDRQEDLGQARESIRTLTRDSITKMLLGNSQLTLAQLETLLADSVSVESNVAKSLRRLCRPAGRRPSRGAFNRTLIQAQNNVIRSIYTVFLLGYVGLYDTPSLQPFIELSDTIQSYVHEARKAGTENRASLRELNERLLEGISSLAMRQTFKDKL
jgi:hypothetical protein